MAATSSANTRPLGGSVCTLILTVAAIVAFSQRAETAPCTTSWQSAASGSYTDATKWTSGVPTSTSDACITVSGTYTVTLTTSKAVNSLTVGGASGAQTLTIASTCSAHVTLATTAGLVIGSQATVALTNSDGCANNAGLSGPVVNGGVLRTDAPVGGQRTIQGNLTNTGTLTINTATGFVAAGTTLTNQGAINIANGQTFTVSGGASFTNSAGGSVNGTGTGLLFEQGGTFTQGAGTTTGTKPVVVDDAAVAYTGAGASTIVVRGSSLLSGTLAAGQTLQIESMCSEHGVATAGSSITNGGAIVLTNGDGCANNASLLVSAGTLTNSGTIQSTAPIGGQRTIQGNVTNTGTVAINTSTSYNANGTTLTNRGAVNIATGQTFTVAGGASFTNSTGGSVNGAGTGVLFEQGGTFTQGAGTTTGTKPVIVDDAAVAYTGAGASTIFLRGSSLLSGTLAASQTLQIESMCGEHGVASVGSSLTNGGTIVLTNGDGCGNNASLLITAGTLTNSGTIQSVAPVGGQRTIQGNVTNTGSVVINTSTSYDANGTTLTNQGALNVATGQTFTVAGGASFTNSTGGSVNGADSGRLFEQGGTFTQGAGTTTGTKAVIVDDAAVVYAGAGASTIFLRGSSSLSGNLSTGQTLQIESTCTEHAVASASATFTNAGTILLTNGDGCGNHASLLVSSGTLTNSGTIQSLAPVGGQRTIRGNMTNTGTLAVNWPTSYDAATTLTNQGAINIATGQTLGLSGGASFTNSTGGSINATGTGLVFQLGGTFTQGAGTTTGARPVIVDDATLTYSGTGRSTISLRGSSALHGNVAAAQTLQIESSCTQHATTTAATSFTNVGTIILTNGDGCGNNATLAIAGGTLTNSGTLKALVPVGGQRTIAGSVSNTKIVFVGASATLNVSGIYTQTTKGTFTTEIRNAGSFGRTTVAGVVTLNGTLKVQVVKPFKGTLGQTFLVITSAASRSGTFRRETGSVINKSTGLYYAPTYSATGVTLLVKKATLTTSVASGPAGTSVNVSGTGWLAADKLVVTFTDSVKHKTTFPAVTADGNGAFATSITIPSAPTGKGTITVKSTITSMSMTAAFLVTTGPVSQTQVGVVAGGVPAPVPAGQPEATRSDDKVAGAPDDRTAAPQRSAHPRNQSVFTRSVVILDGTDIDAASNARSVSWTLVTVPDGSDALLSDADSLWPSFVADRAGLYEIALVADHGGLSSVSTIMVVAIDPEMPLADLILRALADVNAVPAVVFSGTTADALTIALEAVRQDVESADFGAALNEVDRVIAAIDACSANESDSRDPSAPCGAWTQARSDLKPLRDALRQLVRR